ncbi:hypothetical protein LTR09_009385 [Extremus antarcticus]|uniref:Uncharacterized protein n=1 Tax=Extremus antarcticus TaxID=702011 RepID=A0AAJ0G971_9PEZI|nr:hypothetical protein LTR09_009385 [Extremus antarcticus]
MANDPTQSIVGKELRNYCTEITHRYRCGCEKKDVAPCANSKRDKCGNLNKRVVTHETNLKHWGGGAYDWVGLWW